MSPKSHHPQILCFSGSRTSELCKPKSISEVAALKKEQVLLQKFFEIPASRSDISTQLHQATASCTCEAAFSRARPWDGARPFGAVDTDWQQGWRQEPVTAFPGEAARDRTGTFCVQSRCPSTDLWPIAKLLPSKFF